MRVLNDRDEKSSETAPELGFLAVAAHSIYTALGILTMVLGPLPMLVAQFRLTEPWPKVAALLGAVIALTVLQVPMIVVLVMFVLGLFAADAAAREMPIGKLLVASVALSIALGLVAFFVSAQLSRVGLSEYWTQVTQRVADHVETVQKAVPSSQAADPVVMREAILQGLPWFLVSAMLLSLWLSIGTAAHIGVFPETHAYSGPNLRKFRFPTWLSLGFLALLVADISGLTAGQHWVGGVFILLGSLMFIQGTLLLSEILARRLVRPRARTLVYSVAVVAGFYAVMGMGVITPWFMRKKNRLEEVI